MYRVSLANVGAHRTCTPLHEKHQATPYGTFLDPAEVLDIYSGMVAYRSNEDLVRVLDGASATAKPFGLFALDKNPIINDLDGLDIRPFTVWIGGPDAFFTIDAPAFDDTAGGYVVPTTGARVLLYAATGAGKVGKLTTLSSTAGALAELIDTISATRIVIRLLPPAGA